MKKYFQSILVLLPLVFVNALLAHIVPSTDLNMSALPHCAPTRLSDKDIPIGATPGEIDRLPKYYVSQLIGLKEEEEPPYEALQSPSRLKRELEAFAFRMMQISDENDVCDKTAVLYVARFHKYFCPSDSAYKNLDSEAKKVVRTFLLWNEEVMKKARSVSGCES